MMPSKKSGAIRTPISIQNAREGYTKNIKLRKSTHALTPILPDSPPQFLQKV